MIDNAQKGISVTTVAPISTKPSTTTQTQNYNTTATQPLSTLAKTTSTTVISKPYIGSPNGFKAVFTCVNKVKLTWDKAANADSYRIYRATNSGGYAYLKTVFSDSFSDTLARGKTYKYKIIPCATVGNTTFLSDYSSVLKVTTLAKKIAKLSKKAVKNKIVLNIGKVAGAKQYEVKYSVKNGKKEKVKISSSNKITIKNLKKNKKYYLRIRAFVKTNGKKFYTSYKKITVKTKK